MPKQVPRKHPLDWLAVVFPSGLLVISIALAAVPSWSLLAALISDLDAIPQELFRLSRAWLLLRSLAVASLIALLATLAGLPIAFVLTSQRTRSKPLWSALLISPVWMPPFMIYAAGNLLRAPDTLLGRAIIEFATSSPDRRWITIWLGYSIAALGLALWAAPIAGVLIGAGLGFRSNLYHDMLALEPIGVTARLRLQLRLHRPVLLRAFTLVAVLMLGSAVPLHLAQLDTWSIVIWRQLSERPPQQWGRIWVSAMPMIFIAILGARIITAFLNQNNAHTDPGVRQAPLTRAAHLASIAVFIASVLLPLFVMLITLDDHRSIAQFWRMNRQALLDSGRIAFAVGFSVLLIALLTAYTLGSPARHNQRIAKSSILILCVLGLVPGVLVGASIAQHGVLGFHSTPLAPYWASLTRVAFVGAVIGALAAASESPDRRSVRIQLAGNAPRAWVLTAMPAFATPILATLPLATLLAIFEIEAATMVRAPGGANLPQQLLSDLHYARLEELNAAGINLMLLALTLALIASFMLIKFQRTQTPSN